MSEDDNDLRDPFTDKPEEEEDLADDALLDDDLGEAEVGEDTEDDEDGLLWNPDEE